MSNIIDYPTRFKPGVGWNGNKHGRPKGSGSDIRNAISKRLAENHMEDTKEILNLLISHAKEGEQWALKLFINGILPYFLVKPKPVVEEEYEEMKHAETIDQLSKLSNDQLLAIQKIILGDTEEPAPQSPL